MFWNWSKKKKLIWCFKISKLLKKLEFQNRARKLIPFLKCSSLKSRIGIYNLRFHHVVITIYIDRLYKVLSHNVPPLEKVTTFFYIMLFLNCLFSHDYFVRYAFLSYFLTRNILIKELGFLAIFWKFLIFNNFNILKLHCIFREVESETYSKTKTYFRVS